MIVKNKVVCTVLLFAGIPFLANIAARPIDKVKSIKFPPITSPKESSETPCKAADIPTNKLGKDATKAITIKERANSFQPRYLAILIKLLTINSPEK
jgi:hypothetical protein